MTLTPGMHHCPLPHAHGPDRSPSLSVTRAGDGLWLLHCFAGCETADILTAWGMTWTDLWPEGREPSPMAIQWRGHPDRILAESVAKVERARAEREETGMGDARAVARMIRRRFAMARALRALTAPLVAELGDEDDRVWWLLQAAARLEVDGEQWGAGWDEAMAWPGPEPEADRWFDLTWLMERYLFHQRPWPRRPADPAAPRAVQNTR